MLHSVNPNIGSLWQFNSHGAPDINSLPSVKTRLAVVSETNSDSLVSSKFLRIINKVSHLSPALIPRKDVLV